MSASDRHYVVIQLRFEATHCWPGCDVEEVEYLKNRHRHVFHVRATKAVDHLDRQIEIITFKHSVQNWITLQISEGKDNYSCEMWADDLLDHFGLESCEVLEDGENGALAVKEIG